MYSLATLAKYAGAKLIRQNHGQQKIQHLLLDSRQVIFPASSLFIALPGARQDGHTFIGDAYQKGVRNFLISKKVSRESFPQANFLMVDDSREALQAIAARHRENFNLPVIGITGSNGKTIVKEWLYQLLREDFHIARSPKSYNSQIGVPLSVWQLNQDHTLGIFEAGISQPAEMQNLALILQPTIGIFTNLGDAHQKGFGSKKEKATEKALLFRNCEKVIFCEDEPLIVNTLQNNCPDATLAAWSFQNRNATLYIHTVEKNNDRTSIGGIYNNNAIQIEIPFQDDASIQNAIHCWLTCLETGIDQSILKERFKMLESIAMRLEIKMGINHCQLINDAYNSDLTSLRIALDFMVQQSQRDEQIVILSDILQSGKSQQKLYRAVARLLLEKNISKLIAIGTEITAIEPFIKSKISIQFYPSTRAYLAAFQARHYQNAAILLKGARQFEFEKIAAKLSYKSHKTSLEINLTALKNNLNTFAAHLNQGVKIMVMVKAAGYGSGPVALARLLEYQKVDYLAVAYADEGVELREAGIRLPIMVVNPEPATFDILFEYDLEPEVYSLGQFESLVAAAKRYAAKKIKIHVKLDTGMHRLGFEAGQIEALRSQLKKHPHIAVASVFSHLAASENPQHDSFSYMQMKRFTKLYQHLTTGWSYQPDRHLLNSAGIIRFPAFQMEMVRLGIGLFGISHLPADTLPLQTVLTLKASVSQIKNIGPKETVGYGRLGKVQRPSRIATISIGYADGFLRAAGRGNFSVKINGQAAPVLGNVCMDMAMVDITDLDEVHEGDEVIIFGAEHPVQMLAQSLHTIPYEVFTNIAERVKRVYFQES